MSGIHHRCEGCGRSCHGVLVRPLDAELAGVLALAAELGVPDPIDDGVLRSVDGACVFLDEAGRCRLHSRGGYAAKPLVCQQYPIVGLELPGGARWGVDPGCYHALAQPDAPPVSLSPAFRANRADGDPSAEAAITSMLRQAPSVAFALAALLGERPGPSGTPERFLGRWAARLAAIPWAELLPRAGNAPASALAPLAAQDWGNVGFVPVPPEVDAAVRDAVARLIELRLAQRTLGAPPVVALAGLAGALSLAAVGVALAAWPAAFAAWTRVLRAPAFRLALIPDSATMGWLATGARAG